MNKLTNCLLWLVFWNNQAGLLKIYAAQDVYLYTINRSESSENMLIPDKTPTLTELELWHTSNESYGDLMMLNSIGLTEFISNIPIWKSINEQQKDIDLFVRAVENIFENLTHWDGSCVDVGTSGVLMFYNGTSSADKKQLMYAWDAKFGCAVPIPKFVYRIIKAHCSYSHPYRRSYDHDKYHNAVIIIHNDPTIGSDGDRFDCSGCSGWDAIENTYTESGLTYVCHLTEEMSEILGIIYEPDTEPLDLDSMDYTSCDHQYQSGGQSCARDAEDQSQKIYAEYQRLKDSDY